MVLQHGALKGGCAMALPDLPADAGFTPHFPWDAEHGNAARFEELVESYDQWHKNEPISGQLDVKDGWHEVTPAIAEDWLRRNYPGANRKVALATVLYYAGQMKTDNWPKTGQPIIFSDNGTLYDGQHRLWASLLSGCSFLTYVVTSVPDRDKLFAFMDNGKVRTPAVALQTAGYNGVSPTIASVLKIDHEIDGYTVNSSGRHVRLTPFDFLMMVEAKPNAVRAARLASSDWDGVVVISHKDVVGYVGMKIMDLHDQFTADSFFADVADESLADESNAACKLRKLLVADQGREKPMKRHQVLGNMIKAFNAWHSQTALPKRWALAVNDDYPVFDQPVSNAGNGDTAEAAE